MLTPRRGQMPAFVDQKRQLRAGGGQGKQDFHAFDWRGIDKQHLLASVVHQIAFGVDNRWNHAAVDAAERPPALGGKVGIGKVAQRRVGGQRAGQLVGFHIVQVHRRGQAGGQAANHHWQQAGSGLHHNHLGVPACRCLGQRGFWVARAHHPIAQLAVLTQGRGAGVRLATQHGGMAAHGLNCQAQVVGGGLQAAMNVRQVRVVGHKKNTHARLPGREKRLSAGCLPAGNQD